MLVKRCSACSTLINLIVVHLKCDPEFIDELREHKGIDKPFNLSPKHWISVDLNGDVSHELIKDLVMKSYKLVAEGIPKKNK
ncbi:MmcQ/YjbR family DNA-binding protein [Flavobacterium sp. AED]|uniref:MmcQ/YjbR family DNA-binding protein n=1 Tax=Flavobacterium sp. AED TaxID=1423323 RepID=UPI00068DEB8A|nr:MmcQ/YjbR family DNA-binding protein [Flavobacterium sp. AED]